MPDEKSSSADEPALVSIEYFSPPDMRIYGYGTIAPDAKSPRRKKKHWAPCRLDRMTS